jgi:hypothetical protein
MVLWATSNRPPEPGADFCFSLPATAVRDLRKGDFAMVVILLLRDRQASLKTRPSLASRASLQCLGDVELGYLDAVDRAGGSAPRDRVAAADRAVSQPTDRDPPDVHGARAPGAELAAWKNARQEPASARANGLPSQSRQIAQRSPGCTTAPPSAVTRSSAWAMSSTVR